MKVKNIFLSASLALAALCANAQAAEEEVTEYVFNPHWYVQAQVGGQETLGETSFGKLASFNAQIGVGYQFNPVLGLRLAVNGYQSRACSEVFNKDFKWKWNYIAPTVDLKVDLVNLIGGFNPYRVVNAGIFAGIGANIGFKNDEAATANKAILTAAYPNGIPTGSKALSYLWDGTKTRFVGQFGVYCDFRLSNRVSLGLELQANTLNDHYNSKKADNADWYFNALAGVKINLGETFSVRTRKIAVPTVETVVERVVEVPVERVVIKEVIKEVPGPLTHDVFFKIGKTIVTNDEKFKIAEISRYLKENPEATCKITGYADKGTGTLAINLRLAAQRADVVKDILVNEFGIAANRITTASMGEDEYQPYDLPALNRVAIMVAK